MFDATPKVTIHVIFSDASLISYQMQLSPCQFMVGVKSCSRFNEEWLKWAGPILALECDGIANSMEYFLHETILKLKSERYNASCYPINSGYWLN